MPVGTYGTVKGVMPSSLEDMGAQIILGNTFHLWLRPGLDVLKQFGGLHRFEGLEQAHPHRLRRLPGLEPGRDAQDQRGRREFASPVNGDKLFLTPEVSMQVQHVLNSDIVMQFDECTPYETKGHLTTEKEAAGVDGAEPALGAPLPRRVQERLENHERAVRHRAGRHVRSTCARIH